MISDRDCNSLQIFVQSPDLQIPTQTLTFTPTESSQPLRNFMALLLPHAMASESFSSSFYLCFNGKPLSGCLSLKSLGIPSLSTLILRRRFLGGGGDGGATGAESRDCYLKMYAEKKPDKVDPNEQRLSKWLNCALSNEPLKPPCVVDRLGNVFNKEALVEALLGKKIPKGFGHIKGLKDMVKIELFPIPGAEGERADSSGFQCPISGFEFNGKYKFLALKNCGHVLSVKAMKELKGSSCLVCHKEFGESDKIVINGNEEEVSVLRERMETEKGKLKEKKSLKRVKNGTKEEGLVEPGLVLDSGPELKGLSKVVKANNGGGVPVKAKGNGAANKRFKATDTVPENASKSVYASIFTSSSKKSDIRETYMCRSLPLGRN